jgi:hypothetical protein
MDNINKANGVLRKASEFVLIPSDQGILVDGGLELELIAGPLAMSAVPAILRLIDGRRSQSDLTKLLPHLSVEYLREVVENLVQWGVIEVENIEERKQTGLLKTTSFLRRVAPSVARVDAINVLTSTPIKVLSANEHGGSAELLIEELVRNGFQYVSALPSDEMSCVQTPVVVVIDEKETDRQDEFYQKVQSSQKRWLRSVYWPSAGVIEIGPMFDSSISMCLGCLLDKTVCQDVPVLRHELDRYMWIALLASEMTLQLVDGTLCHNGRTFHRYHLPNFSRSSHSWPRFETCIKSSCGEQRRQWPSVPAGKKTELPNVLPHFFEESIAAHQVPSYASVWGRETLRPVQTTKLMLNCENRALPHIAGNSEIGMIDLLLGKKPALEKSST